MLLFIVYKDIKIVQNEAKSYRASSLWFGTGESQSSEIDDSGSIKLNADSSDSYRRPTSLQSRRRC